MKIFGFIAAFLFATALHAGDVDVSFVGGKLDGVTVNGDVDKSNADDVLFRSIEPADADAYFVLAEEVDYSFSGVVPATIKNARDGESQKVYFFASYTDQGERLVTAWLQSGALLIWQKPGKR